MKKLFIFVSFFLATAFSFASPMSAMDTGTYVVIGKDGKQTDLYYRLSLVGTHWKMEGKEAGSPWKDIGCAATCEYLATTTDVAKAFLPRSMRETYDIACIKNAAQAFCRYTLKSNLKQGGYVVVALVTEAPSLIFVQRVTLQ